MIHICQSLQLKLCTGDDDTDEGEDVNGSCLSLALGYHKLGCEEFSLSFVLVNTIFFFLFVEDSVTSTGDTVKSIFFDDDHLFLGDSLQNIADKLYSS